MLKLNACILLFSLPIVTIGAAFTAAFAVTNRMVDDSEGYIFRAYVKAFRENWKKGTVIGILNLLVAWAAYLNFELFNKIEGNPIYFVILGIVVTIVGFASFLYAYFLTARYENTIVETLRNSLEISIQYFVRTLVIAFVLFVEFLVFSFNSTTILFAILIGPATVCLTVSGPAMYICREIEKNHEE